MSSKHQVGLLQGHHFDGRFAAGSGDHLVAHRFSTSLTSRTTRGSSSTTRIFSLMLPLLPLC